MGIYIGGGQFIHAPHTGDVVKISSMSDARRLRRRPPHLAPSRRRSGAYDVGRTAPSTVVGEVLHDARRFSFSVGVTSSCSIVKSRGRITNRLICS